MRLYPTVLGNEVFFGSMGHRLARVLLSSALLLLAALPGLARADDDDLPDRVGRIASVAGQLYLSPEDRANEWAPIELNYPVTSGDNLWVSGDGQAEVDYGGGQFRIAGDTSVHLSRLDDRQLALFVAQGRLIVRLRVLDPGESARIDTPTTQVQLNRAGLYRIDVAPDGQTTSVIVREGEANVLIAGAAQQVLPGQTVTVSGADPAVADIRNGVGVDGFDTWSADRDRRYEGSRSAAYVSRQMIGASDLDYYGRWEAYPEYGAVWFPNAVDPSWTPYRDGYWTTVGAWGLTWVDSAPWGYAPFHYGRWARIGGRWGWCPGSYAARPAWAPALVGWYGGPSWRHSRRSGSPVYGWVPLAWREPYHPSWSNCGNRCWTRHNRPYDVNVRERPHAPPANYANMSHPNAGSIVTGASLVRSKPLPINAVLPVDVAVKVPLLAAPPRPARTATFASPVRPGGGSPVPASTFVRPKPIPVNPAATFDSAVKPAPAMTGRAAPDAGGRTAPDAGGRVVNVPPARFDGVMPRPRNPNPAVTGAPAGPEANQGARNVAVPAPPPAAIVPMDKARVGTPLPPARSIAPAPAPAAVPGVAMPAPHAVQVAPPAPARGAPHPVRESSGAAQAGGQTAVPPATAPGGTPAK